MGPGTGKGKRGDFILVKRDTLPVVWSPTWGCTVLINTGSTSTIIKEKIVRNRGWQSQVKLCTCAATTVAGPTPLSGELVFSLKGLSGKNRSVVAHVIDWASNEYDAILGTDALRCVKDSVRMRKYDWIVRLGTMRYRSEGGVSCNGYVGAAVVKKMDHIRADDVTQHFEAMFHTKGEPLSAADRVRHEIVIPDNRVVYIKPRRYPRVLTDVLRQELKDFLDQGIILKSISPYCRLSVLCSFSRVWTRGLSPKDDIIVFGRSEQEHGEHLVQLLRRLKEFGLQPSVKYLGYVVSERGIHPGPGKVEAIKNLQVPVDVKGVRSLMGLINFYQRFLPCLADQMERWNHLMKKWVKFEITDDMLKSLDWAKEHLCREPVLRFPDFTKQFVVTTDASQLALGAVLSQLDHLGDRPVAFSSRKLTSAESRYSAIERELFDVVWAVEYFRPYLWGRQFLIKTDHKPLVWVGRLKETSAWKERLAAYSFTISHNKGKDNVVADCLSRMVNALPTVQVPASWEIPSCCPEPDRRNVERWVMTWLSDTLDDKARQLVVRIVSGDSTLDFPEDRTKSGLGA
ncbi:hypothetical protein AAG570_009039 [Ranatra chinensis]|uniref:RNA-directed DNA polymerase n=1 Tax=Ranatra chinensis TaxID=642074 RepID=A0ABD0YSL1_9HEMI